MSSPKVTIVLKEADLNALSSAKLVISAPRVSGYIVKLKQILINKIGSQIGGTSRNLTFRYVGGSTALATFSGINAANGVFNASAGAFDYENAAAVNALAHSECLDKGIEMILSGAITANSDNVVEVIAEFDLIKVKTS